MDDGRSDTGRGPCVVSFVRAIDGEQVGRIAGDPDEICFVSTETFQLRSVSPDAIGSARTVRPA